MDVTPEIKPDAWVDEYGDALFGFAMARVKDRATAEDMVQETFLAATFSMVQPLYSRTPIRHRLLLN